MPGSLERESIRIQLIIFVSSHVAFRFRPWRMYTGTPQLWHVARFSEPLASATGVGVKHTRPAVFLGSAGRKRFDTRLSRKFTVSPLSALTCFFPCHASTPAVIAGGGGAASSAEVSKAAYKTALLRTGLLVCSGGLAGPF